METVLFMMIQLFRPRERAMLLAAGPLLLVSPIIEAFGTLSIPLFSAGGLVLATGVLVGGALLGFSAGLIFSPQGSRVRDTLFVCLVVLTILAAVDLSAGGHALLTSVASTRATRLIVLTAAAASLFSVVWPLRRSAPAILIVAALVLFASTVGLNANVFVTPSTEAPPADNLHAAADKPPVVYILLDGAMGIEGLRQAPGGEALAAEWREVLLRYGFRVYGHAFSRHFVSARAIPNALNFDFTDDSWGPVLRHHEDLKVRSRLFENLAADGYEVISYGTEHIDFCFEVAARCAVLPSFNPFSAYIEDDGRRSRWVYHVVGHALRESYLMYRYAGFLLTLTGEDSSSPFTALDIYAFPRWFERFESDVTSTPRGRAYFAHLLMPHAPYVYDSSCGETGEALVGYFLAEERKLTGQMLEDARVRSYAAYVQQYRCLLRTIDGFLARLNEVSGFEDATIVIHGDHGPRISAGQYFNSLSERDLIDNYSALYAISGPTIRSGYDERQTSVQRLTAEYLSGEGVESLGPDNPTVVIDLPEVNRVIVRPMPALAPSAK